LFIRLRASLASPDCYAVSCGNNGMKGSRFLPVRFDSAAPADFLPWYILTIVFAKIISPFLISNQK
jgi:hypothetical protein